MRHSYSSLETLQEVSHDSNLTPPVYRCRWQHLSLLAHKLQAGAPKEEDEAEKMRSQIQWRLRVFADTMTATVSPIF
jgi:hypothetical protein